MSEPYGPVTSERPSDDEGSHPVTDHDDATPAEHDSDAQDNHTEPVEQSDEQSDQQVEVQVEQTDEPARDLSEEPVALSGPPSQRLVQLGIDLPQVPAPVADYVPAVRSGAHVFTSGQLPFFDGQLTTTGVVGDEAVDVTPEEAAALARQCALNAIAAVASVVDLDTVVRVVKVTGFVASAPGFGGQPLVVNGASGLLGQVFGEAGRHARSAVGVAALPLGAPVEVELVVEVG